MKLLRLFILLIVCLLPLKLGEAQDQPFRHNGKTVKQWLDETEGGSKAARMSAVVALGEIGARATDALIVVTSRKDPDVRQLAITFIGVTQGQDSKVVPVLCRSLADKKQSVREAAAESLFNRGQGGRDVLYKNGQSENRALRRGSYRGIVALELRDKKAIALIVRGLNDQDRTIFDLSINAVKKLGGKASAAIPVLERMIPKLKNSERQLSCLKALEKMGVLAIPALKRLILNKDPGLRNAAKKALLRIERQPRLY